MYITTVFLEATRGVGFLGAEVTAGCEPPEMGAGNLTPVQERDTLLMAQPSLTNKQTLNKMLNWNIYLEEERH